MEQTDFTKHVNEIDEILAKATDFVQNLTEELTEMKSLMLKGSGRTPSPSEYDPDASYRCPSDTSSSSSSDDDDDDNDDGDDDGDDGDDEFLGAEDESAIEDDLEDSDIEENADFGVQRAASGSGRWRLQAPPRPNKRRREDDLDAMDGKRGRWS
jgi:hypothetical protein